MKFKIIADSSCNLKNDYFEKTLNNTDIGLEIIPFIVRVDDVDYVDDNTCDREVFMSKLDKCKHASSSCPSPDAFENACTADYNIIVTISAKLSGCYNSACVVENQRPNSVFVIDSKGAAGMERLLVDKLFEMVAEGKSFEEIKTESIAYRDSMSLYFNLTSYDNFVRKGRIKAHIAKIISIARIKVLCEAKDGDIALSKKSFTFNQCIRAIVTKIEESTSTQKNRKCVITFSDSTEVVNNLVDKLKELNLFSQIIVEEGMLLNSFYALKNSLIVAFD